MTKRSFVKGKHSPRDASALSVFKDKYNDGDISFEQFKILSQLNCYYCNCKPSNNSNSYLKVKNSSELRINDGDFIYNGLDRIDNEGTHTLNNVVPSCIHCNFAKGKDNINTFITNIQNILGHFQSNVNIPKLTNLIKIDFNGKERPEKIDDISIGNKIGMLKVIDELPKLPYKHLKLVCECDCGKIIHPYKKDVCIGKSRSCGSARCKWKHPPIVSAIKRVFRRLNPNNGLTIYQFFELSQMNCFYCGSRPNNMAHAERFVLPEDRFIYNGMDKLYPEKGYNVNNVVPSCIICNKIKYTSNIEEFKTWLFDIKNNFLKKNIEEYKDFLIKVLDNIKR